MRNRIAYTCLAFAVASPILGFALYSNYGSPFTRHEQIREISPALSEKFNAFREQAFNKPVGSIDRCRDLAQLGEMEVRLGLEKQAVSDWREALKERFNPTLAFTLAELLTSSHGYITPEAKNLYQEALDKGSKDESFRVTAESRLAQAEHEEDRIKQEGFAPSDIENDFK